MYQDTIAYTCALFHSYIDYRLFKIIAYTSYPVGEFCRHVYAPLSIAVHTKSVYTEHNCAVCLAYFCLWLLCIGYYQKIKISGHAAVACVHITI